MKKKMVLYDRLAEEIMLMSTNVCIPKLSGRQCFSSAVFKQICQNQTLQFDVELSL